jgi:GNAT superfamily N-acetyltransferase
MRVKDEHSAKVAKNFKSLFGRDYSHDEVKDLLQVESVIPAGHTVEYEVRPYGVDGLHYSATVRDSAGKEVLQTIRQVEVSYETGRRELTVHQDLMKVAEEHQGSGLGTRLFQAQVEQYQKMGISSINTEAAWVGQYQWAKLGYSLANPRQLGELKQEFVKFAESKGISRETAQKAADKAKDYRALAAVKIGKGDEDRVGKAFLIARGKDETKQPIPLTFSLAKGSTNLKALKKAVGG